MPELLQSSQNGTNLSFAASEIQAFFESDQVNFTSKDISVIEQTSGDHVLVLQQGNRMVRLYLTTPARDWRRNGTYTWQLSMAWMSGPSTDLGGDGWLYWNRENTVNSQIKGYASLFSAESVILHFKQPAQHMSWSPSFTQPSTKLVMKQVLLGTSTTDTANYDRPCSHAVCEIVDGVVASESSGVVNEALNLVEGFPLYAIASLVVIPALLILGLIIRCIRQRKIKTSQKYTPIGDETEAEEDSNGNSCTNEAGDEDQNQAVEEYKDEE